MRINKPILAILCFSKVLLVGGLMETGRYSIFHEYIQVALRHRNASNGLSYLLSIYRTKGSYETIDGLSVVPWRNVPRSFVVQFKGSLFLPFVHFSFVNLQLESPVSWLNLHRCDLDVSITVDHNSFNGSTVLLWFLGVLTMNFNEPKNNGKLPCSISELIRIVM